MSRILSLVASLILILLVLSPVSAYAAADPTVGNEVIDTANGTLTRTGSGTSGDPYKLQLNLSSVNTWFGAQTFNDTLTANLGLTANGITSTGHITNNGNLTNGGDVAVNGGDVTSTATTGTLFNTNVTTISVGGAATAVTLGANSGTVTLRNSTVALPNATSVNAASATAAFDTVSVGGGYGASGATLTNFGNAFFNGNLTVDGGSTLTGNIVTAGDEAVNGGDITTNASTASVFNNNATTVNMAGAATSVTIGANTGTANLRNNTINFNNATTLNATAALLGIDSVNVGGGYGNTGASVSTNGTIQTNGNVVIDGNSTMSGNLTVDGAPTFNLLSTNDMAVNTDSDSQVIITGLATTIGTPLCLDASNVLVLCAASGASMSAAVSTPDTTALEATVARQQEEINLLKQEIEALKAKLP